MIKIICYILILFISIPSAHSATTASQTVSATLTKSNGGGGDNPGGGISGGAIVGIAAGGGVVSGASALAFAPILLAGLEPNSIICAACPLNCIPCAQNYLQCAIKFHSGHKNLSEFKLNNANKFYFAQNDCEIINGTYDIDEITLPKEFLSSNRIKVNITIASQSYKEVGGNPEFTLGLYKDINKLNLAKKFETQQFLHHYLMKKYETPLKITTKEYKNGLQKISGIIDMKTIQNKQLPMQIVVKYTEDGFRKNLKAQNPKTLRYAYIIEFEK